MTGDTDSPAEERAEDESDEEGKEVPDDDGLAVTPTSLTPTPTISSRARNSSLEQR